MPANFLGSSKNLGNRLINYFRPSYLQAQENRGSAISRALLKFGYGEFSLSIQAIGPTETGQVYSATNIPDYVVLEQYYLDNYVLDYNINRTASSSAYEPSSDLVNVGDSNPSYNKKSINAFVWVKNHTTTLKARWSKERGKYQFFLYSLENFELIQEFTSGSKLSAFFENTSKRFGADIAKKLIGANVPAIKYGSYIVSMIPLDKTNIEEIYPLISEKEVITSKKVTTGKTIYGYNPDKKLYNTWNSLEECTYFLTGNRFENKSTVNRRIDKNIIYLGYYLQGPKGSAV